MPRLGVNPVASRSHVLGLEFVHVGKSVQQTFLPQKKGSVSVLTLTDGKD